MQIYMDVCCLNRPFDNQELYRIRFESEAILTILSFCQKGKWMLAASDPIEFDLSKLNDIDSPVGMAHFIRQFDRGEGDYTTERDALLDGTTMEDFDRYVADQKKYL